MKYSLYENGVSSLNIAIENFKKFYFFKDRYSQSEIYESTKICIIFLENSIELLLKSILATSDPKSIYLEPNSRKIQKAESMVNESLRLEDILISMGNFRTISYDNTIIKYNDCYHKSKKVYKILASLGEARNAITHFGIDKTNDWDELIICILNTFDIIYNYLYPQLITLGGVGHYFTTDDLFVSTIHGIKPLFDDDNIYNNIVDFLDELLETSKQYVCSLRASNHEKKIFEFLKIISILFKDEKFEQLCAYYNVQIDYEGSDFKNNDFIFEIKRESGKGELVYSVYSPYFNVTIFSGEFKGIYFLIVHDKNELYIYNKSGFAVWPSYYEPEIDEQWLCDYENGFCKRYNLSKRNLMLAFKNIFIDE